MFSYISVHIFFFLSSFVLPMRIINYFSFPFLGPFLQFLFLLYLFFFLLFYNLFQFTISDQLYFEQYVLWAECLKRRNEKTFSSTQQIKAHMWFFHIKSYQKNFFITPIIIFIFIPLVRVSVLDPSLGERSPLQVASPDCANRSPSLGFPFEMYSKTKHRYLSSSPTAWRWLNFPTK